MSATAAKVARRDLRRAIGEQGISTIAEVQRNIAAISNSLANSHGRIDDVQKQRMSDLTELKSRLKAYELAEAERAIVVGPGFRGRLVLVGRLCRWLATGRPWQR